jgi:7,8-dihydropterin-6-yl-methyl-4-(beta-D-ribofuranosyl)aminobenzene 5'-phosphate synthase
MKKLIPVFLLNLFITLAHGQQASSASKPDASFNSATILFDAFSNNASLTKAWGFSSLIQFNGKYILFDAGSNADTFKANVARLGIDLKKVDMVIISHAHYDHLNGIDYLLTINPRVKIFFPQDVFWGAETLFNATGQDSSVKDSLPAALRYFDGKTDVFKVEQSGGRFLHANIEFVKDYKEIMPGVRLIPTSAKYMGYFSKYPKSFTNGNFTDGDATVKLNNLPELSLSIQTPKGEVLFVGCSHSGIETIIQETLARTSHTIDLVIGGFHLLPFDRNETNRICGLLKDTLKVKKVAPGHCTGHLAFKILGDLYKENFIYAGLGEKIPF